MQMVTVTEAAKQELKKKLANHTNDTDVSIRLRSDPSGQLGLVLDSESRGDEVIEYDGVKVLLVAQELAATLEGVTLDLKETPAGHNLTLYKRK
jgi:Fe-S cluster assembly iron-binding protein IscA